MILKGLATVAVLLAMTPFPLPAQTSGHSTSGAQASSPYPSATSSQPRADCNGAPCEDQQPRMIVTLPAPAPTTWPVHDRILWGAYLVLALVGYAGVMLGFSTLKKIERNTAAAEAGTAAIQATADAASSAAAAAGEAAKSAGEAAQTALLQTQALVRAERPWVLVTAEPTRGVESSFEITATNRGKSPARITSALDQVLFAADEARLPAAPEFKQVETKGRFVPILLLPGESATLRTFSRDDARGFCESDEVFKSLESWEQRLFLVGRVEYEDLISPEATEPHETRWCHWYIHGKQRSALVPAGPAAYNAHS